MATATENLIAQYNQNGPLSTGQIGDILKASPPTSADQINNISPINTPTAPQSTGNVANANASVAGIQELVKSNLQQAEAQKKEAEKLQSQQESTKGGILETIFVKKSASQTRNEALTGMGYDQQEFLASKQAKSVEIAKLNDEYQGAVDAMNEEMAALETQNMTASGSQSAQMGIERKWAPKLNRLSRDINLKSAILNAEIGNYQEAYQLAQQAVEDETAEYKYRLDSLTTLYDINQSQIDSLDSKYQNALKMSIDVAQQEYENKRQEALDSVNNTIFNATDGVDSTVQTYADLLAQGKITLSNVPQNIRNAVVNASQGVINKPLSDTAMEKITQSESAIDNLNALKTSISENLDLIGPVSGLQALNPYSKARQIQADINRVKQVVGKALEGGVLRKEDEEKYKKILATVTDTPETAIYKINNLITSVQRDIENYKTLQSQTGRFVPTLSETESELTDDEAYQEYLRIKGE